jgi:hypothetical protein
MFPQALKTLVLYRGFAYGMAQEAQTNSIT